MLFCGRILSSFADKARQHAEGEPVDLAVKMDIDLRTDHQADHAEIEEDHHDRQLCESPVDRKAVEVGDINRNGVQQHVP